MEFLIITFLCSKFIYAKADHIIIIIIKIYIVKLNFM